MLISDGEKYKDRKGNVRRVLLEPESVGDNYPFASSCRYYRYTVDGRLLKGTETPSDLISHVHSEEGSTDD